MRNSSVYDSFKNAANGFKYALLNERNFKIHICAAFCAVVASLLLRLDALSVAAVALAAGAVLTTELINTAIEAIVDLYCGQKFNRHAKIAKDAAAAAVLVSSVIAVFIGVLVFGKPMLELIAHTRGV